MADYINKNILSQAYVHIEPTNFISHTELEGFKIHIQEFARSRTDFYLHPDAEIEIEFEEGSLKARITILGTIGLLWQGVASYPDFREGISLLYNDSKRLAEYIVSESQYIAGSKHENVIRLEARTGIIGSVQKVIGQLERIKNGARGSMDANELAKELLQANNEIDKLLNNISNENDINIVQSGLAKTASSIPERPYPPGNKHNSDESILIYQNRRKKLIGRLS